MVLMGRRLDGQVEMTTKPLFPLRFLPLAIVTQYPEVHTDVQMMKSESRLLPYKYSPHEPDLYCGQS